VIGSGLGALAPKLGWLVVFRAIQAFRGSILNPVTMATISNVYLDKAFPDMVTGRISPTVAKPAFRSTS
jgi:MFS family permease